LSKIIENKADKKNIKYLLSFLKKIIIEEFKKAIVL